MCLEQAIGLFQRQVIEGVGIQSHADDSLADADQFRQCRLAERDGQLATTEQAYKEGCGYALHPHPSLQ